MLFYTVSCLSDHKIVLLSHSIIVFICAKEKQHGLLIPHTPCLGVYFKDLSSWLHLNNCRMR